MSTKTVCVFCSADDKVPQEYKQAAYHLGYELGINNFSLLSGGNNSGLMNEVNNGHAAAAPNTPRFGVIPEIMRSLAIHHPHIPTNNVIWTDDVHSRLRLFYDMCNDIIVLPGGYGTMHELMDCLVLSQFGVIKKRIYLLNIDNFWDGILQQFKNMVIKRTLQQKHLDHLIVTNSISSLIEDLQTEKELNLCQGFADLHWKAEHD